MVTRRRTNGLGLFLVFVLAAPAMSADFNLSVRVEGIHLGEPILGPKVSAGELTRHVVLLEFWGIN